MSLFPPNARSSSVSTRPAYPAALPCSRVGQVLHGAHALGVAAHALEELTAIALAKVPLPGRTPLRNQPRVQEEIARAQAQLEAARRYLRLVVQEAWETACSGKRRDMAL